VEGARYAKTTRPQNLPSITKHEKAQSANSHSLSNCCIKPDTDAEFDKISKRIQFDDERIAELLAKVYYSYQDVKDWPRIHRRWRALARRLLMRHKQELFLTASILYHNRFVAFVGVRGSDSIEGE
jgi:hypothetical protein